MQRKSFKKTGNRLAFNTAAADPIFMILQELPEGYFYFLETTPFGAVNFVHRELVLDEDEKPSKDVETKEEQSGRKRSNK